MKVNCRLNRRFRDALELIYNQSIQITDLIYYNTDRLIKSKVKCTNGITKAKINKCKDCLKSDRE